MPRIKKKIGRHSLKEFKLISEGRNLRLRPRHLGSGGSNLTSLEIEFSRYPHRVLASGDVGGSFGLWSTQWKEENVKHRSKEKLKLKMGKPNLGNNPVSFTKKKKKFGQPKVSSR